MALWWQRRPHQNADAVYGGVHAQAHAQGEQSFWRKSECKLRAWMQCVHLLEIRCSGEHEGPFSGRDAALLRIDHGVTDLHTGYGLVVQREQARHAAIKPNNVLAALNHHAPARGLRVFPVPAGGQQGRAKGPHKQGLQGWKISLFRQANMTV